MKKIQIVILNDDCDIIAEINRAQKIIKFMYCLKKKNITIMLILLNSATLKRSQSLSIVQKKIDYDCVNIIRFNYVQKITKLITCSKKKNYDCDDITKFNYAQKINKFIKCSKQKAFYWKSSFHKDDVTNFISIVILVFLKTRSVSLRKFRN